MQNMWPSILHVLYDTSLFSYQEFWFHLSRNEAQQFAAVSSVMTAGLSGDDEEPPSKLGIAIHVNNISTKMIAMASIPLKRLTISVSRSV